MSWYLPKPVSSPSARISTSTDSASAHAPVRRRQPARLSWQIRSAQPLAAAPARRLALARDRDRLLVATRVREAVAVVDIPARGRQDRTQQGQSVLRVAGEADGDPEVVGRLLHDIVGAQATAELDRPPTPAGGRLVGGLEHELIAQHAIRRCQLGALAERLEQLEHRAADLHGAGAVRAVQHRHREVQERVCARRPRRPPRRTAPPPRDRRRPPRPCPRSHTRACRAARAGAPARAHPTSRAAPSAGARARRRAPPAPSRARRRARRTHARARRRPPPRSETPPRPRAPQSASASVSATRPCNSRRSSTSSRPYTASRVSA